MKKTLFALAGAPVLALGLGSTPATAGEVQLHVHLGFPHVIHAAPVVVHPVAYHAPVYYAPRVIYHQPRPRHHGWQHGHGHHYGKHHYRAPAHGRVPDRKGFAGAVRGPRHDGRRG